MSAKLQAAAAIATVSSSGIGREPGGIHQQRTGRRLRIGVAEPREQFPEEGADPVAVGYGPIAHRTGGVQVQGGLTALAQSKGIAIIHPAPTWLPAQGDDIVLIKAPAARGARPKRWAARPDA
ncbi:hypothetical protein AB0O76_14570 [Streptomyces sp. NPDC086554]|uniref:hypothetical protein n=1 Tax=Streptomyces sp. NPDC086554 TaxID=3154864 RepID=UPI00341828B4